MTLDTLADSPGVSAAVTDSLQKQPRGGAPAGNRNAVKHGGRSARPTLALGGWGQAYENLRQQVMRYRRDLLTQVREAHGEVSHSAVEHVNAAARYEMAARIIQQSLAKGEVSPADRISALRQMAHFTALRLQSVARLRLDQESPEPPQDSPAGIYSDSNEEADL